MRGEGSRGAEEQQATTNRASLAKKQLTSILFFRFISPDCKCLVVAVHLKEKINYLSDYTVVVLGTWIPITLYLR